MILFANKLQGYSVYDKGKQLYNTIYFMINYSTRIKKTY